MHQENEFSINQCRSGLLVAVSHEIPTQRGERKFVPCGFSSLQPVEAAMFHVYRLKIDTESQQNRSEGRKTLKSLF